MGQSTIIILDSREIINNYLVHFSFFGGDGGGWDGFIFEASCLLIFHPYRMGAYSRLGA